MRRLIPFLATLALALVVASAAQAAFGVKEADVTFTSADGSNVSQAGAHPFAMTSTVSFNTKIVPGVYKGGDGEVPEAEVRDLDVAQIPGFVGNPTATPRCRAAQFNTRVEGYAQCPPSSAVGVAAVKAEFHAFPPDTNVYVHVPVYNLIPGPGEPARFGIVVLNVPIVIDTEVNPDPPYNIVAHLADVPQAVLLYGSQFTLWGVPADSRHDSLRGECVGDITVPTEAPISRGSCPVSASEEPFLTMPRACQGPLEGTFTADSWQDPGNYTDPFSTLTHDGTTPPNPLGMTGCSRLGFLPSISAKPTAKSAESPTGMDFNLDVQDEGIANPSGLANADIEKAVVTLPKGMSANPSIAEGLSVCSEARLAKETATSESGTGCPNASKIGTVEVETPILEEKTLKGSLFIAKPYENPFHSLLAMYVVIQNRELGISVKQALKVEPDPVTGQLTTVSEDMPQLPFSHFRLHFREGTRSPLTTPADCGVYDGHDAAHEPVRAVLYPSSGGTPVESTSAFLIVSGPNEAPCPKGGLPPFKPVLGAGTLNNAAGSFSQFNLRLSRTDSEQEITHFSIKLPPGITGKLAGVPYCSDAAIQQAKERTGSHGGQEELDNPSCPAASQIGTTLAGAGVGPSLTYAPGKVYLAGPYHGSNLSMVAITAGVVGPFDIGTVVVREGFKIDPETAEVFIDSTGSDPIPHIIRGIPVHLRDIRAYVDRPEFTLNPTDCTRTSTASTVLGSGLDFVSEADDNPITVTSPFQAADCAALRFKPQLGLKLIGGTKRGSHPAFKAHLEMTGIGEAGIASAEVTLPLSEYIENAHFKTICTRVQFKAGAGNGAECPADSIYGKATAITPILGEPLTGPVFLRSSEHQLPDLVVALHNSQVDFDLVGHVDSVKGGGIRNRFEAAPDAPVSSFDLEMAGGKKGLFVNSANLCAKTYRAKAVFTGQNGKVYEAKPKMQAKCRKPRPRPKKHKSAHRGPKRIALRYVRAVGR